jgi:hypothetical protein
MAGLFDNLFGYKKVKLYDSVKTRSDVRLNAPNNYKDSLMERSLSRHLLRNATVRAFLIFVNDYIYEIMGGIRHLKNFKNYTVKKDDTNTK